MTLKFFISKSLVGINYGMVCKTMYFNRGDKYKLGIFFNTELSEIPLDLGESDFLYLGDPPTLGQTCHIGQFEKVAIELPRSAV